MIFLKKYLTMISSWSKILRLPSLDLQKTKILTLWQRLIKHFVKTYLSQLEEREKLLLIFASISLGLYLFYMLIYSPLSSNILQKKKLLIESRGTLNWMQDVSNQYVNIKQSETLSSEKLLASLSFQIKSSSLQKYSYQLEQINTGDIRLSFDEVPYNDFIIWLWNFCGRFSVSVKQMIIDNRPNASGFIKVSVILEVL